MKISDYIQNLVESLEKIYVKEEAKSIVYYFLEEELSINKNKILLNPGYNLTDKELRVLKIIEDRLLKGEPVQYITNSAYFYDLKFFVDKNVLIPRQETEILVDFLVKRHGKSGEINILDIGTGSGCIPVSLKKNMPDSKVYAIDISEEALKICRLNAENNETVIYIAKHDILTNEKFPFDVKFDIIISNPPYVLNSEKKNMHKNVVEFEPGLALYVDDSDPLLYYRHILKLIENYTHLKSELIFEINERFAKEIISLNEKFGFTKNHILRDLNNKDRFIFSSK